MAQWFQHEEVVPELHDGSRIAQLLQKTNGGSETCRGFRTPLRHKCLDLLRTNKVFAYHTTVMSATQHKVLPLIPFFTETFVNYPHNAY